MAANFFQPSLQLAIAIQLRTQLGGIGPEFLGPKVAVLESGDVATCELSFEGERALHDRYGIEAIPMILVADAGGVVQRAFVGATSATDLWAAVAEVRAPGSTPESGLGAIG
jgi:hypothetical protein